MDRTIRLLLAMMPLMCVVSGCTSGCVVSKYPISDEGTSIVERRLVGLWEIVDENANREPGRFQVEQRPESKVTLLVKSPDPNEKGPPLEIMPTELGNRRYLSVRSLEQEKRREEWFVVEYEWMDNNAIRVRVMDPKVVANDVKEKRVAGRLKELGSQKSNKKDDKEQVGATDVYLEEPTDKLRAYVEKSGEKLFEKEWMTYKRVMSK